MRLLLAAALAACLCPTARAAVLVSTVTYHGWTGSYLLSNGALEAVVVPAVGRIMELRLAGADEGVIWAERSLDGKAGDPESQDWLNFGGDKTWPQPQADWTKTIGRGWPPPAGFDSVPVKTEVQDDGLILRSEPDPDYGIATVRRLRLDPFLPVLSVRTEFRKVKGAPVKTGVWVITQLKDPERVFALLPQDASPGYRLLMGVLPKNLQQDGRILSWSRDRQEKSNLGLDSESLLWMDRKLVLRIDARRQAGEYAGGGSSAFIYSNPDPQGYVELETAGPLSELKPGQVLAHERTYTLQRRTLSAPLAQARSCYDELAHEIH